MATKNGHGNSVGDDALAVELLNSVSVSPEEIRARGGQAVEQGSDREGREAGEGAYLSNIHIGSGARADAFDTVTGDGERPAAEDDARISTAQFHAAQPEAGGTVISTEPAPIPAEPPMQLHTGEHNPASTSPRGPLGALFEQVSEFFRGGEPGPATQDRERADSETAAFETTAEAVAAPPTMEDDDKLTPEPEPDTGATTPGLVVEAASGLEDGVIALNVSASLGDSDGSESLSIMISGVPGGATLSAGIDNGDGSWTLTAAQLQGLTLTPGSNLDTDFTLTVTATATESNGGATATKSATLAVDVDAVADVATLVLSDALGNEDAAILLDITSALTDVDGSETLSITIDGVPTGALLSAGTDNGDGSWTLTSTQLSGLTITPALNTDGDFTLTVTATTTEGENGDTATVSGTIDVGVAAVADVATLVLNDALGNEDAAILLDITSALTDADGSETLSITIDGVPTGALLSAGIDNGDGSWTLTSTQLSGLTITPALDTDGDFQLTVTATTTEGENGDTATISGTIDVGVAAVADVATLVLNDALGNEDAAILLDITSALTDVDGSETLSITIDGVPTGALLSAGTDNGDGSWTLTSTQLFGLTITPALDTDGDFQLTVTATTMEGENGDTATVSGTIDVGVNAVADAATLILNNATGNEDAAILLDITSALTDADGSETLSITIDGVPTGALLSAGTDNGDGSWTLTSTQLSGLTITPALGSDADFQLTVTATTTEGENGDTATISGTIDVGVAAVADVATLVLNDALGNEDAAILLDITSALTDADGSETLSITIDGVPTGALLSAGTDNGDGSWTLTSTQLSGLTITPALGSDADFQLTVTATTTEGENGDTATISGTIDVGVAAVADVATLVLNDALGNEDAAILLDITSALTDADGSETLSITIDGVPTGALLSAGTDNGDGSWTLNPADLSGLTITPALGSDGDFTLTVTATTTEGENGDTATISGTIDVGINAVADVATLILNNATGNEDAAILLDITSALTDLDGSESLSVTISDVPTGATLSAGTDNGDGSWTLTPLQLAGLTITPAADSDADFTLNIAAVTTELLGGATETVSGSLNVTVNAVADTPDLAVNDSDGFQDTAIALDITSALTDLDGSEMLSITINGVPTGALLSAGADNGDGSWTLTAADISGLTITPPAGDDGDFTLSVTATATESGSGDTSTAVASIDVTVRPDASFEARFASGSDGFTYVDGAFGTSNPAYESGAWQSQGGGDGALKVSLGGVNDNDINGMSGAWQKAFNLEAAGNVVLTFQYKMTMTNEYEADEFSQVLAAVDGIKHGSGGNDYIVQMAGNGNGGAAETTGWQVFTVDLGELAAGNHTLALGGFNNLKTLADESTEILFDNVTVSINGEDTLLGGSGNDNLTGTDGKDTLYGMNGNDTLSGGAGNDYLFGHDGTDTLYGGDGEDVLSGGSGNDTLYGDAGDDILDGDAGNDNLYGGDGDDVLYGDDGADQLYGDAGNDTIHGGSGFDSLYGGDGNDSLYGGIGNDTLQGGAGDDTLQGGAGADAMYGGDGNDTLLFGFGEGLLNTFDGSSGWTDTIQMQGVDGGPGIPLLADWTMVLLSGSIQNSTANSFDLSADSAGTILMTDGSELTFSGVEKIEW